MRNSWLRHHKRSPAFTIRQAREALSQKIDRYFLQRFPPRALKIGGFILFTFVSTLLLGGEFLRARTENYREGDVVRSTVISPADISAIDARETERRRAAAIEAVRPVWRYEPARAAGAQKFRAAWQDLQRQAATQPNAEQGEPVWTGEGDGRVARIIIAHRFDPEILNDLLRLLREANDGYVYDDREADNLRPEIRLVDGRTGAQSIISTNQTPLKSLSMARQTLRARLNLRLKDWPTEERDAIFGALAPLLAPTLIFDAQTTEAARREAAASVPPATITLKRNQVIAREGDTVTEHMLAQFEAVQNYGAAQRRPHHFIGLFLVIAALYWIAWKFTEKRSSTASLSLSLERAFMLLALSVIVETILMRVGFTVADSIASQSLRPPTNDPTLWSFAIPFASAALLVALLVDTQLAFITGLITALFAGLLAPNGMLMTFYALTSSAAAIYGIHRYRERQSVTLAGLFAGAVNALMALAVILAAQQPLTLNSALLAAGCGIAGGLLTTIFTSGGLPINESLFGILTDVKLLELSNADLPILSQLAMRAPGTNQHSHAVSQLAEDACRAIGANALLARIGALYHDIGKLAAPEMFVENQTGENPHDHLPPERSARILIHHVSYGLKLAKEIGLPKQIADFIPQHHGTRTLHFFLRKAQAQAAPGQSVDESQFRYPGPKPQSKEAAVMMLADSCEAAVRSLARPDPENISAIVSRIFDAVVSDGQLDECDLSLRELTKIREAMTNSLIAIYHPRVDYPGFNPPEEPPHSPSERERRGASYAGPAEVPISKGGEVEDEAISRRSD
ncbi:HD family phosphohydrolase [Pyrinomonas methylaliphatogenes]|uniref:Uncharacterized domain HDIG-containing protein n=1 Tax=Pyrinomonas methylaliphatogenes TaxID=454194 RepID=A0A0B6WVH4_9BACT|nr:HDIG domain-containing metalloprotein [Pyrinomonas methylaliphatogenes]CDM64105.1 uncharacterized domain HDIG-containing protein [Pyrinomonas methylaliphatogenes]